MLIFGRKKKFGSTLIETLIYIALIALIVTSIVLLTSSMLNSKIKTQSALILEEEMRFAMEVIKSKVSVASYITSPVSAETIDNLTLVMTDPAKDPTVFSLANGYIFLTEGAGDSMALVSEKIEITNFSFTGLDSTPDSVKIDISGQLRNASGAAQSTETLTSSATIRR